MKILIKALVVMNILSMLYQFEQKILLKEFSCQENQNSLAFDLQDDNFLNNKNSFGITLWMKIQANQNVYTLFSFNSLYSKIVVGLGNQQRLSLNSELLSISSIKLPISQEIQIQNSNSQVYKYWNFVYVHFKIVDDQVKMTIALNDQITEDKEFELINWRQNLYLNLGQSELFEQCKFKYEFKDITIYNNTQPFNLSYLARLSTGKLNPVFLTKMNEEPSYNKYYENLIQNELGPIKNGISAQSNSFFTSIASAKNRFQNKQHLISGLSLFLLPRGLLDQKDINQSYVFLIHFKLYYTNYGLANYQNLQLFPLYQRYSKDDIKVLIRADFKVELGNQKNQIASRYFINEKIEKEKLYQVQMTQTNDLETIPFQYLMIQVENNPYFENPSVTFRNGYEIEDYKYNASIELDPRDRHLIGDSDIRNTTRKEYFAFVTIDEVAFFRGALLEKEPDIKQQVEFYSGFQNEKEIILTCRNNFNIQRQKDNKIIFNTCNRNISGVCQNQGNNIKQNCDLCIQNECIICRPGYELNNTNECIKCERGYDSFLKKCFEGNTIDEFNLIQFKNLRSTQQDIILNDRQYIAVTAQNEIDINQINRRGILFFYQNLDNETRLIDVCFLKSGCQKLQDIHFSLLSINQNININYFILGNTAEMASQPQKVFYQIYNSTNFNPDQLFYKNFNCQIFGDYYFIKRNKFYGNCIQQCPRGYYPDQSYFRCLQCPKDCEECNDQQVCTKCQQNLFLKDNKCYKCMKPCKTCGDGPQNCTSCEDTQFYDAIRGNCNRKCTTNKINNCESCDYKTGQCVQCQFRYQLVNNTCQLKDCGVKFCQACSEPQVCDICMLGYQKSDKICIPCQQNCAICPKGYQNDQGKCIKQINKIINTQKEIKDLNDGNNGEENQESDEDDDENSKLIKNNSKTQNNIRIIYISLVSIIMLILI